MVYTTHVVWWFWGWFIIVLTSLRGFDPSPCRISRLFLQMGWPQCFIKILFVNRALVDFPFPAATETHATWGIYIYVCIYVYMYVCIYVYMYICIYIYSIHVRFIIFISLCFCIWIWYNVFPPGDAHHHPWVVPPPPRPYQRQTPHSLDIDQIGSLEKWCY